MAREKIAVQFICYSPRIYSGFDKFNLELASCLKEIGVGSVFVFSDEIHVSSIFDDLIKAGVSVELISTKNKLTILRDVLKIFFRYKPKIVHSHFENYIQLITAVLSKIFGAHYFITFHSTISLLSYDEYRRKKGKTKQFLLKFYYRFLVAVSDSILCVSEAVKSQFITFSRSGSSKIRCFYLGVEVSPEINSGEESRKILSLPENKILFCNVSAIEYIKGIDILIDAIFLLKSKYKQTDFICCHIGGLRSEDKENQQYRDELENKVKNLELGNNFKWLGHKNDIEKILSAFDFYVHPSRMEGLGVAIMEACTHSLPVIGTRVGGIPEIVLADKNGLLFTEGSADELALNISKLIVDSGMRIRMGIESGNIVREKFNISKQTKQLCNIYLGQ